MRPSDELKSDRLLESFVVAQETPLPERQIAQFHLAYAHPLESDGTQAHQLAHAS